MVNLKYIPGLIKLSNNIGIGRVFPSPYVLINWIHCDIFDCANDVTFFKVSLDFTNLVPRAILIARLLLIAKTRWELGCWLHDIINSVRPNFQNHRFIKWPSFSYHLVQTKWEKKIIRKLHFVLLRSDNPYLIIKFKFDDKIILIWSFSFNSIKICLPYPQPRHQLIFLL